MPNKAKTGLRIREIAVFGMLGALMFASKIIMEALPNIHLLGTFVMALTLVYRKKALYPIYVFVLLAGLFGGFALWWPAYLYVWTVLWAVTMLLPKRMPKAIALVVYPAVCALHGLFFGVLYAPAQALMFGFDFEQTLTWIAAGLYFDIAHFFGDLFAGLLILPLSELLKRLTKNKC